MKILIIGFQRSGTTLLRRLIRQHPDVLDILHENVVLYKEKPLDFLSDLFHADLSKVTFGEKIAYYNELVTGKVKVKEVYKKTPNEYCKGWYKLFHDDARLIHIIRHPLDVAVSNKKTFGFGVDKTLSKYRKNVPKVMKRFKKINNGINIKFEELVANPHEALKKLFAFCNIDKSSETIEKVLTLTRKELRYFDQIEDTRALAYRKQLELISVFEEDLSKLLGLLNY